MITFRHITTNDPAYEPEKELRNRVLRLPLGLELSDLDTRDDQNQVHIIAQDEQRQVVGCVLIRFDGSKARLRQMAVDERFQHQGIGKELVQRAEQAVRERGVRSIELHARLPVCGFYEQLGYKSISEPFIEVTIPHVRMMKGNITIGLKDGKKRLMFLLFLSLCVCGCIHTSYYEYDRNDPNAYYRYWKDEDNRKESLLYRSTSECRESAPGSDFRCR